jgi:hypothetical protein
MIDEVLDYALEKSKNDEIIETQPIWADGKSSADISATIE